MNVSAAAPADYSAGEDDYDGSCSESSSALPIVNLDACQKERIENDGPFQIEVKGAGTPEVNGIYHQDGYYQNACKYSRKGMWRNGIYEFSIHLSAHAEYDGHKYWYIGIITHGGEPEEKHCWEIVRDEELDLAFYSAQAATEAGPHLPPLTGWNKRTFRYSDYYGICCKPYRPRKGSSRPPPPGSKDPPPTLSFCNKEVEQGHVGAGIEALRSEEKSITNPDAEKDILLQHNQALNHQNQELKRQIESLEQEKKCLADKNQTLEQDKDKLVEQSKRQKDEDTDHRLNENEKKYQVEIASLRATIKDYERQALETYRNLKQLPVVDRYERKEKEQRAGKDNGSSLQEKVTSGQDQRGAGFQENAMNRSLDGDAQASISSSRRETTMTKKRARHDEGAASSQS